MVSADNLNLDVLEHIFSYLSGNDLLSVALVSRSFFTAVIPRLYTNLRYRIRGSKGYNTGKTVSPFQVIAAHPELTIHVRSIEICSAPLANSQVHPAFVQDCSNAISICRNLQYFRCTVPNILHYFLLARGSKVNLRSLRIHAQLSTDQAHLLIKLGRIRNLSLEYASWNVVDTLPRWIEPSRTTLTHLTLYMISELNVDILTSVLIQLPKLTALHVVGCLRVDHVSIVRLLLHIPLLESLSMTTTENPYPFDTQAPPLYRLRHLALDTRYSVMTSPAPAILSALLEHLKGSSAPLVSFSMKLPDNKVVVGNDFIKQLLGHYAHTLRRLAFLDCSVGMDSLAEICKSCIQLERLDVAVPIKELHQFTNILSQSHTLKTLVDVVNHVVHGTRLSLTRDSVRHLMINVRNLRKVVSNKRIWVVRPLSTYAPLFLCR
ncbi:hypothetical protein BDQ12DRAFT_618731 [Crucibulum laeve]|uniref:F-box domain-containing protein n=1 Tax=Crucibulum laeve TaxID=68775 RepID=A0A5C3LF88_9AGAR|nr:hypothetical protein BDQ12DRAFT_618731 [Crucibulum laeve]